MENKKRPNDDTIEPEVMSSNQNVVEPVPPINDNSNNSSSQMEIDATQPEKTALHPVSDNASSLGETNKRLKLTVETPENESVYSTPVERIEPSKESIGLSTSTESTESKENDKAAESHDLGVTGGSTSAPAPSSVVKDDKIIISNPDIGAIPDNSTVHVETTPALTPSLPAEIQSTSTTASTGDEDSIMTASSAMESQVASPVKSSNDQATDIIKPSTEGANLPQSLGNLMGDSATIYNPEISTNDKDAAKMPIITKQTDDTPSQAPVEKEVEKTLPVTDTNVTDTSNKLNAVPSTDVEMTAAENTKDELMISPKPAPSDLQNNPTAEPSKPDLTEAQNTPQKSSQQDTPHNDANVSQVPSRDSIPKPISTQPVQSSDIPTSNQPETKKQSPTNQLPPLPSPTAHVSTTATATATTTQPIIQQNIKPRNTMSVSALLVGDDDEDEGNNQDESSNGGQIPRGVFDQFDNPKPDQSHSSHAPITQKPSSQISHPIHSPHHPGQIPSVTSNSQDQPTPIHPVSISSPRHLGATNALRTSDPSDISSRSRQSSPIINRATSETAQPSRRAQEAPTIGNPASRGSSHKDYTPDEVVESGGVSGYGSQRHHLASPVGTRSHESMNGSNQHTTKLPGVGSVAGIPTNPQDYTTHHGSSYRGDNTHAVNGRQNSYSPNQHLPISQSTGANGHQYSNPVHSGNPLNNPSVSASSSTPNQPKLVIKNDSSLMLDSPSKSFLGYYLYSPSLLLPNMQGKENSRLEVRVASPYLTYDNIKVKKRELWGTDIYTDDSDIVAMLIHSGFFIPPTSIHGNEQETIRPSSQQHNFVEEPIKHICPEHDLAVTLRVVPKLAKYQESIRNRIKSRTWGSGHDGVSLKIESVKKLNPGEALNRGRSQSKRRMKEYNQERLRVLSKVHDETTESLQNERAMRTATFEFTHQGDPCFKYSPELVMDRHDGLSRKWTSWRLKKEVMILENDEERYEISLQHHAGTDARRFDQYRFAVISPRTSLSSWSKATYPLPSTCLSEVLYEDLDWQDFEWVERGVVVQPSQKSKNTNNGSSSMMEGIESTGPTSQATTKNGEDEKTKTDTSAEPILLESTLSKSHDSQQDGVFCVVSRLFWRPITEHKPLNSSSSLQQTTDKSRAGSQDAMAKNNNSDLIAPRPDTKLSDAPSRRLGTHEPEAAVEKKTGGTKSDNITDATPGHLSGFSLGSSIKTSDQEMTAASCLPTSDVRQSSPAQTRRDEVVKEETPQYEEGELEDGEIA